MSNKDYIKSPSSAIAVLKNGDAKHYVYENTCLIGRTPTASICLVDQQISRKHCIIQKSKDNKFTICDVSNSGTFLNERKLIKNIPQELQHYDSIKLAGLDEYTFGFYINMMHFSPNNPCKKKILKLSPLSVEMNDLNLTQNMEKEDMDGKLTLVEAEMCRLKEELQQKLKAREDELEKERLKVSEESVYNKEQADKAEIKLKEMLEEKTKTLEEHENKISEVTKKLEELQKTKNGMEERHQIEREELEKRCKVEIAELKKKLESSEIKHQQFEELQARLEETRCILLESELEQQRLFEAKVEVETKLESKIIDLTNDRENKEEQVKELKKKLKEKEQLEERVKKDIEGLEEDMMCSICAEMYIEPTALNCGHMFCKMCIKEWNKKQKICPMCRAKITTTIRIFNMDSVIERNIRLMPEEARTHREALIVERKRGKIPQKHRSAKKRRHERETQPRFPTQLNVFQEALIHTNANRAIVVPEQVLEGRQPDGVGRSQIELHIGVNRQVGPEGDDDPFRVGWVNTRSSRSVRTNSPVPVAAVDLTNLTVDYEPPRSRARTHTVTSAGNNSTIDLTNI